MNRTAPVLCIALLAVSTAFAQQAPPPAAHLDGKADRGMRGPHGDGGGMGIVPPGMWWSNPATVTALALTADQQKRLGDTFLNSRIQLVRMHASLEEEQLKLEPLLNQNPPDQNKALAEIGRIADLRAELEKTNAKMLLSLRGVLTADQWTKLQAMGPMGHGDRHDGPDRRDGPARGDRPDKRDRRDGRGQQGPVGGGNLGNPPLPPPPASL